MAKEDYTTYTEVDIPADRIQKIQNHVDALLRRNETVYLYKDYDTGFFKDWEHKVDFKINSSTLFPCGCPWALANALKDNFKMQVDKESTLFIHIERQNSTKFFILVCELYNGTWKDPDVMYIGNVATMYYCTLKKVGTKVELYIYSDYSRTNLLQKQTLTCTINHEFRYVYACQSRNVGDTTAELDLDIENLEFTTEAPPPPPPPTISGGIIVNDGMIVN